MAHSQMNVVKFYQSVIDDVISGVRENFLDEGMDEQVLQELKQLWETKVLSSKAVEVGPDNSEPQPPQLLMTKGNGVSLGMVAKTVAMPGQTQILTPVTTSMHNANNSQLHLQQHHQTQQLQQQQSHQQQQQQQSHQQQQHQQTLQQQLIHQQTQQAPPQPTQQTVIVADPNKTVPVQITLPAPAGTVTIHVPVSALQGNTLQTSLTGPVITAAMALPPPVATSLLQQHVLAALQAAQQQQQTQQQQQAAIQQIPRQTDGQDDSDAPGCSGHIQRTTEVILQLDGHNDTSDEEDEDVDDDGDDDDEDETEDRVDDDENEDEANGGGQEEEPLNSGDDVSEDDPTDLFDTDNVIVCQYDKITRSRNKWKFYLKDGIMNLNGKDFVFQKSNGDAEW